MSNWIGYVITLLPLAGGAVWLFYMFFVLLRREEQQAEQEIETYNNDPSRRGPRLMNEWR